jgi:tRNA 2-selenouridine synthase
MVDVSAAEFLNGAVDAPIFDVRSPGEFAVSHIPGALSLPLFDDAERAEVGTIYKQVNPNEAMLRGLDLVGPKMSSFVRFAQANAPKRVVRMYCWRGGMRSHSMAWLLENAGFKVILLVGGYKAYKGFVRESLSAARHFLVVGGNTGSGKTRILHELARLGEQVIDLEGLAEHKGSAFGKMTDVPQPSTDMFENLLYEVAKNFDPTKRVWIEDESSTIGSVYLPEYLYRFIRQSGVVVIETDLEMRISLLAEEYSQTPADVLVDNIRRIRKRLGFDQADMAVDFVTQGDFREAIRIVLSYYDKTYLYGLSKRDMPVFLRVTNVDYAETAAALVATSL